MFLIINVFYALLIGAFTTLTIFIIAKKLCESDFNLVNLLCLSFVFVFTVIQSCLFLNAMDKKDVVNEQADAINLIISQVTNQIDDLDLIVDIKELTDEYSPILKFLDIDLESKDEALTISTTSLNKYYTVYMWKRVCWILSALIGYILTCLFLTRSNKSKSSNNNGEWSSIDISDWKNY